MPFLTIADVYLSDCELQDPEDTYRTQLSF